MLGANLGIRVATVMRPVAIDFRDVYAGLLEQHLGIEAARILPGYAGSPLQVIA
jgi:hypothetical protein